MSQLLRLRNKNEQEKNAINVGLAIIVKQRSGASQIESMDLVGDVKGRDCIICDDMIDTAGTLCKAAKAIKDAGARSVYVVDRCLFSYISTITSSSSSSFILTTQTSLCSLAGTPLLHMVCSLDPLRLVFKNLCSVKLWCVTPCRFPRLVKALLRSKSCLLHLSWLKLSRTSNTRVA